MALSMVSQEMLLWNVLILIPNLPVQELAAKI